MNRAVLMAIAAGSSVFVLGGCGTDSASPSASTPASNTSSSNGTTQVNTQSGLKQAQWSSGVSLVYGDTTVTMKSNDIPNHPRPSQYAVPNTGVMVPDASTAHVADDPTRAQDINLEVPTNPEYTDSVTEAPLGSIGLMISGAVLFNPYEGNGTTVAMSNNFSLTDSAGKKVYFVDGCSGHPTPMDGMYHYHAVSSCITKKIDTPTGPSHLIGVALDGFPIYGPRDADGKAVPVTSLDRCNGIVSATPEFPDGIYHYVLPSTTDATSSIRCFHGKVDVSQIQQMPPMGAPPAN